MRSKQRTGVDNIYTPLVYGIFRGEEVEHFAARLNGIADIFQMYTWETVGNRAEDTALWIQTRFCSGGVPEPSFSDVPVRFCACVLADGNLLKDRWRIEMRNPTMLQKQKPEWNTVPHLPCANAYGNDSCCISYSGVFDISSIVWGRTWWRKHAVMSKIRSDVRTSLSPEDAIPSSDKEPVELNEFRVGIFHFSLMHQLGVLDEEPHQR